MRRSLFFPIVVMNFVISTMSWGSTRFFEETGFLEYIPQTSLIGMTQTQEKHEVGIEVMLPFNTNIFSLEALSYGGFTGRYGEQGWQVGAGGGYQYTFNANWAAEGYALVEYQRSLSGNGFWRFSPGIAAKWGQYRLSSNAYLPLGKNEAVVDIVTADTDIQFADIERHKGVLTKPIYEKKTQEVGIKGVDMLGSWQITEPLTLSVGGYYLLHKKESKLGMVVGLAYQYSEYSFEVQGHYTQKEIDVRAQVSVRLDKLIKNNVGSKRNNRRSLVRDGADMPVLKRVGTEWAGPETHTYKINEKRELENLYFFKEGAKGLACTVEEPCGVVSRDFVNQMPEHAYILLAQSKVPYKVKGSNNQDLNILPLNHSQSILGRSADFKHVVSNKNQPKLQSALTIRRSKNILVDHIHINPTIQFEYGVWVDQSQYITLHHVSLGAHNSTGRLGTSIKVDGSTDVQILDTVGFSDEVGFAISKSQSINVEHSRFDIDGNGSRHIGLLVDTHTTKFNADNNTFSIWAQNGNDIVGMLNIEGIERKANNNTFNLSYRNISEGVIPGIVTICMNGSDGKPLSEGRDFTDQWNNIFKRDLDSFASSDLLASFLSSKG